MSWSSTLSEECFKFLSKAILCLLTAFSPLKVLFVEITFCKCEMVCAMSFIPPVAALPCLALLFSRCPVTFHLGQSEKEVE